jgi:predicted dehydrogenase
MAVLALTLAAVVGAAEPKRLGVALYGSNGHQLAPAKLAQHPHARLVAVADYRKAAVPDGVAQYATLDEVLRDPQVELVSLCSARRAEQARDAIRCLEAGKHVYAEKPAALTEAELDAVLAVARRTGKRFHEMAGTTFVPHYAAMRQRVRDGAIGEVVQVFVQKSYRYGAARPQDEAIDGGMFLQAGVHAVRMVEQVGGVRIRAVQGWETGFGKPEKERGDGKIAATAQVELENGGLAAIVINYLNPGHRELPHGNETLRVFGTKGFVESDQGGARTRLVTATERVEPLERAAGRDYFDFVAASLATGAPMPLTSEEELHPLRVLLRAKERMRAADGRK